MANQKRSKSHGESLNEIRRRLIVLFAGNETNADLWLRTPNQYLDEGIPLDIIQGGEEDRQALELLVGSMEDRIPI